MGREQELVTLQEFCLRRTRVGELVVVRDAGYVIASAYIDAEDLFFLPPSLSACQVSSDKWGELRVATEHGDEVGVPCHYVDIVR